MSKIKVLNEHGNKVGITPGYIKRDIDKRGSNVLDYYQDSLSDRLDKLADSKPDIPINSMPDFPENFKPYNNMWRYEPVDSRYFFKKMIGEGLYPDQQEACDVMCSSDPFKFTDLNYSEIDLFWGKRSGKDATIAKIFVYQCYRLCCLINPQKTLGLGIGSAMDIVNVSKSGKQARAVFFKYLKNFVKRAIDRNFNMNWFSTNNFWYDIGSGKFKYQDLREGESIQKDSIDFGRGVGAHSLNSDRYTGEGLNIILAVIDEVGSMPVKNVLGSETEVGLRDSLKTTLDATSKYSKLVCVSYKYGRNCAMSVLVKKNERDPSVFISKKSLFDVRPDFDKNRLKREYIKNPVKAKMMYEIADLDVDIDTFYDIPYAIEAAQDVTGKWTRNPFKDGAVVVDDIKNAINNLYDWFKGHPDKVYVVHIDLAKGNVHHGKNAIGLSICHMEDMRVSLDERTKKYLKEKMGIEGTDEIEGELRPGVVVDLGCHIICKSDEGEVRISDIRKFITNLKILCGFDFFKVTFDGWQSLESIQEFNKYGIDAEELSVDRTPKAYMTEKDLVMMGLFKIYPNRIWVREKKELRDTGKKIDHPEVSNERIDQDGLSEGSKDLSDSTAACSFTLMNEIYESSNICTG